MRVYAVHGEREEDYFRHIEMTLEHRPHIVIDDGGDLAACLHGKRPDLAEEVRGGGEETTTGILRLKALAADGRLKYPVVAVNDARCKHLFDNRYGTGQSVWDSVMRNTNLIVASKTVVVAGYGWCGRGIAMRAAALGASVIVTEIDPVKAIEARMDGYQVMTMRAAAPLGDIFISATGCKDVITLEHMALMKDRVILANAGHFNVEVDVAGLEKEAERAYEARDNIMAYVLPGGKTVHVMAEGRLVNIAAADGHPAEIMDMSFAVQFLSALYIQSHYRELPRDDVDVSAEIDTLIAERKLAAWDVEIDRLTPEQERYLSSWEL
jgi:adenosylhomocysteinase